MSNDSFLAEEVRDALARNGIAFDILNPAPGIVAMQAKALELDALITGSKASKEETKVSSHPFDVAAAKNKKAAAVAAELVKAFLTACEVQIVKTPHVAWHLAQLDDGVAKFFTQEVQYFRFKAEPKKPVNIANKGDEMRADRKILTQQVRQFLVSMPGLATITVKDEEDKDVFLLIHDEEGGVKLPNLQGGGVKSGESTTGKYGGLKSGFYVIDGKTYPIGTDYQDIMRVVFTGTDRIGKKAGDLFDPIDAARKAQGTNDTSEVTVEINGHTVTYKENRKEAKS